MSDNTPVKKYYETPERSELLAKPLKEWGKAKLNEEIDLYSNGGVDMIPLPKVADKIAFIEAQRVSVGVPHILTADEAAEIGKDEGAVVFYYLDTVEALPEAKKGDKPTAPVATNDNVSDGSSTFGQLREYLGQAVVRPCTMRLINGRRHVEVITAVASHLVPYDEYEKMVNAQPKLK